jgi:hypothetical protein
MFVKIEKSFSTPEVTIQDGKIEIKGRSIPEDSFEFYMPVIESVTKYLEEKNDFTEVIIYLEYINSSSKKFLTNILNLLEKSYLNGTKIEITWQYDEDDESIYDLGNDLKSFIKIPIFMKEII